MNKTEIFSSKFHGVGQGLFYSLLIGDKVVIYDCGSETKGGKRLLKREIKSKRFKNKTIELFILSHLHRDHINGIEFFKDHKIKEFVIPYFF